MLSVTGLLSGQRELLCSFTGFLPPGHTVGIQNNDPTQVIVRIPGQRSALNRQELTQFVDSIRVSVKLVTLYIVLALWCMIKYYLRYI